MESIVEGLGFACLIAAHLIAVVAVHNTVTTERAAQT